MIRKYKGHISDCIDVAINWTVLLYFVFQSIRHYTTINLPENVGNHSSGNPLGNPQGEIISLGTGTIGMLPSQMMCR